MRFAVKLATYKTPRASSSATSDAAPPIDTTLPNVPAKAAPAIRTAPAIAKVQDLRCITKLHPPASAFFRVRLSYDRRCPAGTTQNSLNPDCIPPLTLGGIPYRNLLPFPPPLFSSLLFNPARPPPPPPSPTLPS